MGVMIDREKELTARTKLANQIKVESARMNLSSAAAARDSIRDFGNAEKATQAKIAVAIHDTRETMSAVILEAVQQYLFESGITDPASDSNASKT